MVRDNLVVTYMNYKINYLLKYGLLIMHSSDEFLSECINNYLRTYINSYYYLIFDTVNSKICNDIVLKEEIEGKRLEMLDEFSNYELIDSNDVYKNKINYINDSSKIIGFLIKLDLFRFNEKEEANIGIKELVEQDSFIKEKLGNDISKLISLVIDTNKTLNKFFERKDTYFSLDYLLFKDVDNYVKVVINNDINVLHDNYKNSLVERCYRDKKILFDKFYLLGIKFIKQLLLDIYNNKLLYDKYFILLPEEVFEEKRYICDILNLFNNPLVKRYLVLGIKDDNYYSNQAFIKKYNFSIACIQDFSHINDVSTKLTNLDNSNLFDYVIVDDFKEKDYNEFIKYSLVNMDSILFNKE